jgi:K+-transporting ATPase ATPase A chain
MQQHSSAVHPAVLTQPELLIQKGPGLSMMKAEHCRHALKRAVTFVGALTFFPALTLGPVLEHLLLYAGKTF